MYSTSVFGRFSLYSSAYTDSLSASKNRDIRTSWSYGSLEASCKNSAPSSDADLVYLIDLIFRSACPFSLIVLNAYYSAFSKA
jgi:hypothetical protein